MCTSSGVISDKKKQFYINKFAFFLDNRRWFNFLLVTVINKKKLSLVYSKQTSVTGQSV